MSEFFKALEQAERDRQREAQAKAVNASPPASRTTPREDGPPVLEPTGAKATVPEPPRAKAIVPGPAPVKPAPLSPLEASSPESVFRPSLQKPEGSRVLRRLGRRQPLLIAQTDPGSVEANAYRTVRANIELMSENGTCRRIAITSAATGDGKSTTAANLAIVAAQGGRRICLVDADFRRASLHDVFGLPNVDGLAWALEQGKPLQAVARSADIENLSIVVAGRGTDEKFHDLLTAQRLERVLRDSEAAFDMVIFDTPPVILVADALSVAAACDGVVIVVRAKSIPFSLLKRAIEQVKQVNGRILGVLVNQATDADSHRHYSAYYTTRSKS